MTTTSPPSRNTRPSEEAWRAPVPMAPRAPKLLEGARLQRAPFGVALARAGLPDPQPGPVKGTLHAPQTRLVGAAPDERRSPEALGEKRRPRTPERDVEPELASFRPLPAILAPTPAPVTPTPQAPRADVARLAGELLTRLRVGRTREGAVVELRVRLAGRGELDVRLVESPRGLELHVDGADDSMRRALREELARRGLDVELA